VRQRCAMHLSDRGRRDRLLVELREELRDREAEILFDHLLDVRDRKRADVVLQPSQLGDDVGRQDVGPRREQLAELDEGRAELVEHLAEMLTALRRLAGVLDAVPAPREEIGQPVSLEPVAEAVPDGDLSDLRQAAEVAGCCLSHRFSVAWNGTLVACGESGSVAAASAACCRLRSARATNGTISSMSTTRTRPAIHAWSGSARETAVPSSPARTSFSSCASRIRITTAASCNSARTGCCTSAWATAAARAT